MVEQYVKLSGDYYDSERWVIEVEDEYKPVLALSHLANNAIGDIHRMTSFSSTAKDRTDPAYGRVRQSRETPMWV